MQINLRVLWCLCFVVVVVAGCGEDASDGGASHADTNSTSSGTDSGETSEDTLGTSSEDMTAEDISPDSAQDVLTEGITYHNRIRALMERRCLGCHVEGGIGPFPLVYDPAQWTTGKPPWANVASVVVSTRRMPPWMPDGECKTYLHERRLTEAELADFAAWTAAGFPEGDPSTYVAPEPPTSDLGAPDIVTDSGVDYQANPARPDDYRCFPLAHTFDVDTFVRAYDVVPDAREIVHHVILYLVEADDVANLEALDASEAGPGYTCFGGPRAGGSQTLTGWVPGQQTTVFPAASASVIPAGSRIVMQIHYNTLNQDPAAIPTDRTQASLWLTDNNAPSEMRVDTVPFPNLSIQIQPDDPASTHDQDVILPAGGTIIGLLPHMHTLGKQIRVEMVRADQAQCLLNIPNWDFNWQQTYMLDPADWYQASVGDIHRMRCVFDNSAANQPVINGQQQDPRLVTWGESTTDEMCLNYLVVMRPFGGAEVCGGFETCLGPCAQGDELCFLNCAIGSNGGCLGCMAEPLGNCSLSRCPVQLSNLASCLNGCSGGDTASCLLDTCSAEFDAHYTCIEPHIRSGACNDDLQACGVSF